MCDQHFRDARSKLAEIREWERLSLLGKNVTKFKRKFAKAWKCWMDRGGDGTVSSFRAFLEDSSLSVVQRVEIAGADASSRRVPTLPTAGKVDSGTIQRQTDLREAFKVAKDIGIPKTAMLLLTLLLWFARRRRGAAPPGDDGDDGDDGPGGPPGPDLPVVRVEGNEFERRLALFANEVVGLAREAGTFTRAHLRRATILAFPDADVGLVAIATRLALVRVGPIDFGAQLARVRNDPATPEPLRATLTAFLGAPGVEVGLRQLSPANIDLMLTLDLTAEQIPLALGALGRLHSSPFETQTRAGRQLAGAIFEHLEAVAPDELETWRRMTPADREAMVVRVQRDFLQAAVEGVDINPLDTLIARLRERVGGMDGAIRELIGANIHEARAFLVVEGFNIVIIDELLDQVTFPLDAVGARLIATRQGAVPPRVRLLDEPLAILSPPRAADSPPRFEEETPPRLDPRQLARDLVGTTRDRAYVLLSASGVQDRRITMLLDDLEFPLTETDATVLARAAVGAFMALDEAGIDRADAITDTNTLDAAREILRDTGVPADVIDQALRGVQFPLSPGTIRNVLIHVADQEPARPQGPPRSPRRPVTGDELVIQLIGAEEKEAEDILQDETDQDRLVGLLEPLDYPLAEADAEALVDGAIGVFSMLPVVWWQFALLVLKNNRAQLKPILRQMGITDAAFKRAFAGVRFRAGSPTKFEVLTAIRRLIAAGIEPRAPERAPRPRRPRAPAPRGPRPRRGTPEPPTPPIRRRLSLEDIPVTPPAEREPEEEKRPPVTVPAVPTEAPALPISKNEQIVRLSRDLVGKTRLEAETELRRVGIPIALALPILGEHPDVLTPAAARQVARTTDLLLAGGTGLDQTHLDLIVDIMGEGEEEVRQELVREGVRQDRIELALAEETFPLDLQRAMRVVRAAAGVFRELDFPHLAIAEQLLRNNTAMGANTFFLAIELTGAQRDDLLAAVQFPLTLQEIEQVVMRARPDPFANLSPSQRRLAVRIAGQDRDNAAAALATANFTPQQIQAALEAEQFPLGDTVAADIARIAEAVPPQAGREEEKAGEEQVTAAAPAEPEVPAAAQGMTEEEDIQAELAAMAPEDRERAVRLTQIEDPEIRLQLLVDGGMDAEEAGEVVDQNPGAMNMQNVLAILASMAATGASGPSGSGFPPKGGNLMSARAREMTNPDTMERRIKTTTPAERHVLRNFSHSYRERIKPHLTAGVVPPHANKFYQEYTKALGSMHPQGMGRFQTTIRNEAVRDVQHLQTRLQKTGRTNNRSVHKAVNAINHKLKTGRLDLHGAHAALDAMHGVQRRGTRTAPIGKGTHRLSHDGRYRKKNKHDSKFPGRYATVPHHRKVARGGSFFHHTRLGSFSGVDKRHIMHQGQAVAHLQEENDKDLAPHLQGMRSKLGTPHTFNSVDFSHSPMAHNVAAAVGGSMWMLSNRGHKIKPGHKSHTAMYLAHTGHQGFKGGSFFGDIASGFESAGKAVVGTAEDFGRDTVEMAKDIAQPRRVHRGAPHKLSGGSFFGDIASGFESVGETVVNPIGTVGKTVAGLAQKSLGGSFFGDMFGGLADAGRSVAHGFEDAGKFVARQTTDLGRDVIDFGKGTVETVKKTGSKLADAADNAGAFFRHPSVENLGHTFEGIGKAGLAVGEGYLDEASSAVHLAQTAPGLQEANMAASFLIPELGVVETGVLVANDLAHQKYGSAALRAGTALAGRAIGSKIKPLVGRAKGALTSALSRIH